MAKRMTDSTKWSKPFIRTMKAPYKLLWIYILDECDHAGIWQVDFDCAELRIGERLKIDEATEFFLGKIRIIDGGQKWFIEDFIEFQYGELDPTNRVHNSAIKILKRYDLLDDDFKIKPLITSLEGCKDKDKEKDKDKAKDKGGFDFSFMDESLKQTYADFLQMRKSIKKPILSQLSLEANYKQLLKMSSSDFKLAKEIVEQSTAFQWQGFVEIKQKNNYDTGKANTKTHAGKGAGTF